MTESDGTWILVACHGVEAKSDRTWSYDGRVDHQLIKGSAKPDETQCPGVLDLTEIRGLK